MSDALRWLIVLFVASCAPEAGGARSAADPPIADHRTYVKPSDAELRQRLTPLQYWVTQRDWTEPPYRNDYWDNEEEGLYVSIVTGQPLFTSVDKYDSHTGWPSFTRPLSEALVYEKPDHKLKYLRREIRSVVDNSHLGHVFNDGPKPAGLRYCMNSAALRFVPLTELEAQGYGAYKPLFSAPPP